MSKKRTAWVCTGTYFDEYGHVCDFESVEKFLYIPRKCVRSKFYGKKEFVFDDEASCQLKCDNLNRNLKSLMKKHGYKDFKEYILSREHETDVMLTVKDLIKYLKTQDPDALVVGYDMNSFAYVSQPKELPSMQIKTVKEDKKDQTKYLTDFYMKSTKNKKDAMKKVKDTIAEDYRYVKDNDVIIRF
jgi:hypothetical protein